MAMQMTRDFFQLHNGITSWKDHITNLKGACAGRPIELSKVRGSISKETFKNVVNSTVISKVNYGDILYASATSNN